MARKIKKILLLIPPAFTMEKAIDINPLPPLGLAYLGAVLEENNIEVKIVDCLMEGWEQRKRIKGEIIRIGLSFDQIEEIIRDFAPDIVGVNSLFTKQHENAHRIYEVAKKVDSSIITIAGGAHPTAMPDFVMSDTNLDYLVLGEGEESLVALIKAIEGTLPITEVDGLGYREGETVVMAPKKSFISDLDAIPFPAYHLLNMEKYFGLKASHGQRKHVRFSPIITSRGCPAKCTFCTAYKVWGRRFRERSPENVVEEMKYIKEKYGIEEIMFEDDNVTLNPQRAEELFDLMIKEKINLHWDTPNGVAAWTLNKGLIRKMKESGCYMVNFALESGNQEVLDNIMKKPINLEKVKPMLNYAQEIGLDVSVFLVIGMPGETEEQMWDSFRLAADLGTYFPHISVATPYQGSELYEMCKDKGYLRDDFSMEDMYIRSFSIHTEDWDEEKLKKILGDGQRFLLVSFIKKHPFSFVKMVILKMFLSPGEFFKKLFSLVTTWDWSRIRG